MPGTVVTPERLADTVMGGGGGKGMSQGQLVGRRASI